jgi:hypothetical protein
MVFQSIETTPHFPRNPAWLNPSDCRTTVGCLTAFATALAQSVPRTDKASSAVNYPLQFNVLGRVIDRMV